MTPTRDAGRTAPSRVGGWALTTRRLWDLAGARALKQLVDRVERTEREPQTEDEGDHRAGHPITSFVTA
jgi:hypothetical protein